MHRIKISLVLITLMTSVLIASAQKEFAGYDNVLTGVALKQSNIQYKGKSTREGFFGFILVTTDCKLIVTNNQFDKRITFDFTKADNVGNKYFYISDSGVFMMDFSDEKIVYYDAKSQEVILEAEIDSIMTLALMETIKKQ